ncbi:hypothetical protein AQUCO_08900019v1 [Aquilegia coerulea]|nr:hypothetical protein AQUCO_08900019v1 [Aquilegia coerulea]
MDYHKEMYKKRIKEKELTKIKADKRVRKGPGKEVRFNGKIEQKDLQTKADTIKKMMDKGYRVKCMAVGTEDEDLGGLLARLSALIEDVAVIESGPRVEKKQAYVVVRHAKFGFKKGKKASQATTSSPDNLNDGLDEDLDGTVSHSESEDDIDSDEMETPSTSSNELAHGDLGENETTWSISDVNEDLETIFSFDDNKGVASSSITRQMGGETGGVLPLEEVANASLPYSKPGLPPVAQGPMQKDDNRYRGPTHMGENRYGGRTEVKSRFQPTDGAVPQKDVASASTPYSKPDPTSTNPKLPFLAQGPTQMDDNRYRGPTQMGENRYGGRTEVRSRFQPTDGAVPQKDVASASIPYSKPDPRSTNPKLPFVAQGPTQMDDNRYRGPTQMVENRYGGAAQMGENRYGGRTEVRSRFQPTDITNSASPQKDVANASITYSKQDVGPRQVSENRYGEPSEVRSSFQPTMSRERPAGNTKPSEFSSDYSSQANRGLGASKRVHQDPESPYQGKQSQNNVSLSPSTEHGPVRNIAPPFGNSTQPPTDEAFMQEQSIPNASGSQGRFGIFSAPKHAVATRQSVATEVGGDGGNNILTSSKTQ